MHGCGLTFYAQAKSEMIVENDLVVTTYGTLASEYDGGRMKGPLYSTKVSQSKEVSSIAL